MIEVEDQSPDESYTFEASKIDLMLLREAMRRLLDSPTLFGLPFTIEAYASTLTWYKTFRDAYDEILDDEDKAVGGDDGN